MAVGKEIMIRSLDDISEDLDDCGMVLMETEAQYLSECHLFGDAGPGQWLDVRHLKGCLNELQAEWRLAGGDVTQPPEHAIWDEAIEPEFDPNDIPF